MESPQELVESPCAFGEGPLPGELASINWGAVFLGGLFALFHRLWWWLLLFVILRFVTPIIFWRVLNYPDAEGFWVLLGFGLAGEVAQWVPAILFGLHANREIWERDRRSGRAEKTTIAAFRESQRTWARFGLLLTIILTAHGFYKLWFDDVTRFTPAAIAAVAGALALVVVWRIDRHGWANPKVKLTSGSS